MVNHRSESSRSMGSPDVVGVLDCRHGSDGAVVEADRPAVVLDVVEQL
jgi:hypothetical protein